MIFTTVNSFTILDSDSTLYFTAYLQLPYDIVVLIKELNFVFNVHYLQYIGKNYKTYYRITRVQFCNKITFIFKNHSKLNLNHFICLSHFISVSLGIPQSGYLGLS